MSIASSCIILGIDPGSRVTGFGIIKNVANTNYYVASGCIRCSVSKLPQRIQQIFNGMQELMQQYQPDEIAIEEVFVGLNSSGALKLGQARGAALAGVFSKGDASVAEYSARQVKKSVIGYGAATKEQMQHMVCKLLGLTAKPAQDAADALGIALCHSYTRRGLAPLIGASKMTRGRIK